MRYTEQFMDTCFSFEEGNKLRYAFGAALYHAEEIMGKVIVLYGGPGTGKSTILWQFQNFLWRVEDRSTFVIDDFDLRNLNSLHISKDKVAFIATNRLPDESLPEHVKIIRTSGNRVSHEDYKKFLMEMLHFPEDFFKKCMTCYVMEHKAMHANQTDENEDSLPNDFLSYWP